MKKLSEFRAELEGKVVDPVNEEEIVDEAVNYKPKTDPRFSNLRMSPIDDMPAVLLLKRKSIRVFPDGARVALYYADTIDRFVTIPFNDIGVSNPIQEEVVEVNSFKDRVNQLREQRNTVPDKRYMKDMPLGPEIDDKKFKKAYINIERATKAYKDGDFKKGDSHAKKAGKLAEATIQDKIRNHPAVDSYEPNHGEHFVNLKKGYHWSGQRSFGTETAREAHRLLKGVKKAEPGDTLDEEQINELSRSTLATYASFAGKAQAKAFASGDAKKWRKREKGTKLALSKYRGETKKERTDKKTHDWEPKFTKTDTSDQTKVRFTPKKFQWEEKIDEAGAVGAVIGQLAGKAIQWGVKKALGSGGDSNQSSSNDKADINASKPSEPATVSKTPAQTTNDPFEKTPAGLTKPKKERDDEQDEKIANLEKRTKAGGNNVNETFVFDFTDGSVSVTGAVLNDIALIYEKANTTNKKKIIQTITESAEGLRKFADFAIKTGVRIK